tara:strand:+ start:4501 stop:5310 length:810 start_codon:yes stop_codon:yes gene_type:complete
VIQKIYILTTKVRSDRLEMLIPELEKSDIFKIFPNIEIECVYGYHHTQVDLDFLREQGYDYCKEWELDESVSYHTTRSYDKKWDWWYRPVRLGEMCCAITHLSGWKALLNDGVDCALFLEDDVSIRGNSFFLVNEHLKYIPDKSWSMFYCARNGWEVESEKIVNDFIVVPNFSYNMHAYVLTNLGATQLCNGNFEKNIIINDEYVPLFYNHPRKNELGHIYNYSPFKVYATYNGNDLVSVRSRDIVGSDTEYSLDVFGVQGEVFGKRVN